MSAALVGLLASVLATSGGRDLERHSPGDRRRNSGPQEQEQRQASLVTSISLGPIKHRVDARPGDARRPHVRFAEARRTDVHFAEARRAEARFAEARRAEARFAEARRAAAALEYDRALTLAQEALEQGDAEAALTRRLAMFQAEMAVAVGLEDTAVSAFARALAIDPSLELPLDASPRLKKPFARARARVGSARLVAIPASQRAANGFVRTRVRVEGDVLQQVFGARVHLVDPPETLSLARTDGFEGHWPCAQGPCPHTLSLTDARGNELLTVGTKDTPLLVLAPLSTERVDPRPWYRKGWPYVVLGGALAAGGGYLAVRTAQADSEFRNARDNPGQHTYAEVSALDADRRRFQLLAGGGFVLALGAGALGAAWWSWSAPEQKEAR